jgi:hypothetical protein
VLAFADSTVKLWPVCSAHAGQDRQCKRPSMAKTVSEVGGCVE